MRRHRRIRALALSAAALVFTAAGLTPAGASERGWELRLEGVQVRPNLDQRVGAGEGAAVDVEGRDETGFRLGIGYRFSDRVGVQLSFLQAGPEVKAASDFGLGGSKISFSDDLEMRGYFVELDFHLTPRRAVDLHVGPLIALVRYGDLAFAIDVPGVGNRTLAAEVRSDLAWGLALGVEVPLGGGGWRTLRGGGWRATAAIRYLDGALDIVDLKGGFRDEVDFDPLILSLGIAYRF